MKRLSPNSCSLSLDVSNKSNAYAVDKRGPISKFDNSLINPLSLSTGLSAPNREPMPSLIPLINEPPLSADIPAPRLDSASPAIDKLRKSITFIISNDSPNARIDGAANAPNIMNGNSGAINAIAPPIANIPPDAFNNPMPSTSAIFAILSVNAGNALATKLSARPNGRSATPNAAMATEPANINGDAKLRTAAAAPSVTSPAANTPIVLNPTSFIKLRPNANGTTAAPNNNIAAAPLIIAVEPLPNACANTAKPPNANVPFINDVKSTSLNCLSPIPARPTEAPNNAIAAAPLTTLLSPNFLTASAIDCMKPPLLPIGIVALSALSDAPFNMPDTLPPMLLTLSFNPAGTSAFALAPRVDIPFPTTSGAPPFVSLPINPEAMPAILPARSFPPLNIALPYILA